MPCGGVEFRRSTILPWIIAVELMGTWTTGLGSQKRTTVTQERSVKENLWWCSVYCEAQGETWTRGWLNYFGDETQTWAMHTCHLCCVICGCENVACGRCSCLHPPSIAREFTFPQAKNEKASLTTVQSRMRIAKNSNFLTDLTSTNALDSATGSLWLRRVGLPSCFGIDLIIRFFKPFKLLVSSMSWSLYRMNGCVSFWSLCHMFIMQSFQFSFCFNEIRSLIQLSLITFFIQLEYPTFLITISFSSRCNTGAIFQCKFVILNNLLFSPPKFWQRVAVFVIVVPSFHNGFVSTMLGLTSFLQHLFGFVVYLLPYRSSMFGTTSEVLLDDVTWNWQGVTVLFVQHHGTLRRYDASSTWAVYNANFSSAEHNRSIVSWKMFRKARRSPCCPCRWSTSSTFRWTY